jgi:hypothetical protein
LTRRLCEMHDAYPVSLEPDGEGGVVVSFPDVPEVHTQGENREDALEQAEDALIVASAFTSTRVLRCRGRARRHGGRWWPCRRGCRPSSRSRRRCARL